MRPMLTRFMRIESSGTKVRVAFPPALVRTAHLIPSLSESGEDSTFRTLRDSKEHFLQAILLGYLRSPGLESSAEGFVGSRRVFGYLQALGFTPEQIDNAVSRCFTKKLVETGARRVPAVLSDVDYSLRLTSVGLYHISELSSTFTYLDAVVVDTPILDKDIRSQIKDAHSLAERLERARAFCFYLDRCWEAIEGKDLPFEWPEQSAKVRSLMSSISSRA